MITVFARSSAKIAMMHREWQKRTAKNIKRARGKLNRFATNQVYVTEDGERRLMTSKRDIEQACINENKARFSQLQGTPFTVEPLLSEIGLLADTEAAQEVLEGTWSPPEGTDIYTRLLLQEMKMPDVLRVATPMVSSISVDDHIQGWEKQKEQISSAPEGLHFGHYKAGISDEDIAEFDAIMRSLPYEHGFAPDVWKGIVDVEILKKAGVYDIEKMRTITLMHSEFNMNNKKLGRDLMYQAEAAGTLAHEQYGSRKHMQLILPVLNKCLIMDLLRQ